MSICRRRLRPVLLAMVLGLSCLIWQPATAATAKPDLAVRIDALSPARLTADSDITMSGTVTNRNAYAWRNVQAYLVMSHAPFTSRSQLDEAVANSSAYTGDRIVELSSIGQMGDIAPGAAATFTINVTSSQLHLNGADGVYPVGVQILGTDTEGKRSNDAIARATTFLPHLTAAPRVPIATSIGIPFIMPSGRNADRTYADATGLMASIGPGGQLGNLLDVAAAVPPGSSTVIVDPALLVAVDDLAHRRNLPAKTRISDLQVTHAEAFLARLRDVSRHGSTWYVGYGNPDVLALQRNSDIAEPLVKAVDRATRTALDEQQLIGRHISWPTRHGVTASLLQYVRGDGDRPVIVNADDISGWTNRNGSLVRFSTSKGPMPILVDDALTSGVPGLDSTVALRQRLISDAALASMSTALDPESHADSIAVLPAGWNPGPNWAAGKIAVAFSTAWVDGITLDDLLARPIDSLPGKLPSAIKVAPVDRSQLMAATDITTQSSLLRSIQAGNNASAKRFDRDAAEAVSLRGRRNRAQNLAITRIGAARADKELTHVKLEGPQSVTLSSSNGQFPLTISNDTKQAIKVGVRMDSSNPALSIPALKTTTIDAGESHTLNVNIDIGDQGSTSVAAQLITPSGKAFGTPVVFNVRSSAISTVLWIAIGAACLFVIVAMLRRFTRRHRGGGAR